MYLRTLWVPPPITVMMITIMMEVLAAANDDDYLTLLFRWPFERSGHSCHLIKV